MTRVTNIPDTWSQTEQNRGFVGTTGELNLGVGEGFAVRLDNPSDSGVDMYLYRIVAGKSVTDYLNAEVRLNPTGNLPTTNRDVHNRRFGSSQSSQVNLLADGQTSAPSGGVDTQLDVPIVDQRSVIDTEFIIPPDAQLTLWLGGGLVGAAGVFIGYWYEVPT